MHPKDSVDLQLQWGRPCGGAESFVPFSSIGIIVMLQWGRPCGGAERTETLTVSALTRVGFNGAAPVEGRKVRQVHPAGVADLRLQWGRPCGGAERSNPANHPMSTIHSFNGAAPVEGRKAGQARDTRMVDAALQWGRPCGGAESALVEAMRVAMELASMGPPLWRGGKQTDAGEAGVTQMASMGPPLWRGGKHRHR